MGEYSPQRFGIESERYVQRLLWSRGMRSKRMPRNWPFDLLLANGKRVEVKSARMHPKRLAWVINVHRHGKVREGRVDAYVFLLDMERVAKVKPLVLILPAPVQKPSARYSFQSLLTVHNWQVENWQALGVDTDIASGKKPPASEIPKSLSTPKIQKSAN